MTTHRLKTWTEFYQAVVSGVKTFEARKDDRGFKVGDFLNLVEVDPDNDFSPTGQESLFEVVYLLKGEQWGVMTGCVILGIRGV